MHAFYKVQFYDSLSNKTKIDYGVACGETEGDIVNNIEQYYSFDRISLQLTDDWLYEVIPQKEIEENIPFDF